ncbi:MAG: hypothetical protein AAF636_03855 [Pseudomonadota bacterium]
MLIFLDAGLAYLATPKTGTTAIETALQRRADLVFRRGRKHMPARRFVNKVAPFIADTFNCDLETVAVMREPTEQLRSWYRYRTRDEKAGEPKSTRGVDFETFVTDVLADEPPEYARINGQFSFLTRQDMLLVDHLFAYTHLDDFRHFMAGRLGIEVAFATQNVSPDVDASLSGALETRLQRVRAGEFQLYTQLQDAGGYLHTPQGLL